MSYEEKYQEFIRGIKSDKLKQGIRRYHDRLEETAEDDTIKKALSVGSEIRRISQKVLFDEGVKYIWLVPIETSIDEYSQENFIAINPYNMKSYSLVQSPQIQKEAAAVTIGSNFRLVDCYRGEKTDATHSNIFQQIDVEFANKREEEIRKIAGRIITECFKEIAGITLPIKDVYSYCELIKLYGTDSPNLGLGLLIEDNAGRFSFLTSNPEEIKCLLPFVSRINYCEVMGNRIVFNEKVPIEEVRRIRNQFTEALHQEKTQLYGYWVSKMPYAELKNGIIRPVHHVMSMPIKAKNGKFNFLELTDQELCGLECNSFDLMVCNNQRAVEVLGGDERINTFELQYDALKRLKYNPEQYAYLLQTLKFNDEHEKKTLGGFAIGVERLAQFLSETNDMKYVQLFPTNLPDGELIHAISREELEK